MYHENTFEPIKREQDFRLQVGFYSFYFEGSVLTGNVKRIGNDTITVDVPLLGKTLEMPVLKFLDSSIQKL
jgi:hypothetical protein